MSMNSWELSEYAMGISIYSREIAKTQLIECKGITRISASMEALQSIFYDTASIPKWMKSCRSARIIQRTNNNQLTFYLVHKVPLTLDRDVVLEVSSHTDIEGLRTTITYQSVSEDNIPSAFDCIRMPLMICQWTLDYCSRNKTKITAYFNLNLGGGIPFLIANRFIKEIPLQTLYALKGYTGSLEPSSDNWQYMMPVTLSQRIAIA